MNFERLHHKTLPRDGVRLSYVDAEGTGLPVVFQHGLCGSAMQTAEAFPADESLRLLTLECRGHGDSDAGDPALFSIAAFTDDVLALIDAERLAPVVLGGISMGAAIALRIAALRPERVRALVLVRPAWMAEAAPAHVQPNAEVGALIANHPIERAIDMFEGSATAIRLAAEAPDNLASLRGFFRREPLAVTAALLQRIAADGPGIDTAALRAISVPTLVIGHAADAIHPLALARELAASIPSATFVEITPKAVSREAYQRDLHHHIQLFTRSLTP